MKKNVMNNFHYQKKF